MTETITMAAHDPQRPAFVREFETTLSVSSQYILYGNIRDRYLVVDGSASRLIQLAPLLWESLRANRFSCLIAYDAVDGLSVYPAQGEGAEEARAAAKELIGDPGSTPPRLPELRSYIETVVRHPRIRAAFLVDYASRLLGNPSEPGELERSFFLACAKLSQTAPRRSGPLERPGPLFNPVIWVVDGERDLPSWLSAGNVYVRPIGVHAPDLGDREVAAELLAYGVDRGTAAAAAAVSEFATQAEGLSLQAMVEVTRLARDRGDAFSRMPDAVGAYKLGVVDNPWRKRYLRTKISKGERALTKSVKGQDQAITKTLDILKRAALGLSGVQAGRAENRPRGVLFFAGPTGVGKTQLAKAVTTLVFGDESAYLRFDMSEFSAQHSADRLIGAPPGYVGFEAGGQLTNAVRADPFRVILFDEIEKAHELILDKFLQILEDGRLTDGSGQTTYFSECILIFTSNLGVMEETDSGESQAVITPGTPFPEVEEKITTGVRRYFVNKIRRPELLNRLGGNIVVFDFIRREAANAIFADQLALILQRVRENVGPRLEMPPNVVATLRDWCTEDLTDGGRGIGNQLETLFINPLARALFPWEPVPGTTMTVTRVCKDPIEVELK
jgi:hypothetical protein